MSVFVIPGAVLVQFTRHPSLLRVSGPGCPCVRAIIAGKESLSAGKLVHQRLEFVCGKCSLLQNFSPSRAYLTLFLEKYGPSGFEMLPR